MKRALIAFLVLCASGAAHAERARSSHTRGFFSRHSLVFGADTAFAVPLGNYADANSVGASVAVTGELSLLDTLSGTMRVGFEGHADRDVAGATAHVHALPILLGTKYYLGAERMGLFGTLEAGSFVLLSSATPRNGQGASSTDLRFGMGAGLGIQQDRWNVRVNVHTQDVSNFGSAIMLTGGIGYEFAGI
jgi:hypothetical protein